MKSSFYIILILIIVSCKNDDTSKTININFNKAIVCRDSKSSDSAFFYFNLAKNDYLKTDDSVGAARSLANMAIIQTEKGDFFGGIETSLESNKIIKPDHSDSLSRKIQAANYNNMAIASNYLKNYRNAFAYYLRALYYINPNDTFSKYIYYNNIGDVLTTLGQYKNAEKYLSKAIKANDDLTRARALNNLAKAKYMGDETYNPLPELLKALEIRKINDDKKGQNSSFETLSSYYLDKDRNISLDFAEKMLAVAEEDNSSDDQILALQRIITLDPINYLKNFKKLNSINDSLQTARNQAKNQFAIIRFDVEKLKTEKAEQEIDLLQRNIGLGALSLLLIGGTFWYKKRKKRLQQEKELEVKNTQLKLSKKVHDVVANGIYQVMTKIENQKNFDKNEALDELEFVYEKSRDISYDKDDAKEEVAFDEKISNLIASFKNDAVNTYVAGNGASIWENVPSSIKDEVYQIIRELLVNMKKHSRAERVAFKFERLDDTIQIHYTDNGIGISGDVIRKNGLTNTGTRIETIQGKITFDTNIEKGLRIYISFPTS